MFCKKRASFHALFIKKKVPKRCRFEQHCRLSSSPGRAEKQGKEAAFPCIFTAFLPPFSSKRRRPRTPTCPKLSTCWRGGSIVATPSSFSPVFAYKKRGSTREKRQKKKRDREERTEREKRKKRTRREEKTEKNRGRNGENHHRRHLHRRQQLRPATSTATSSTVSHRRSTFFPLLLHLLLLLLLLLRLLLHCSPAT